LNNKVFIYTDGASKGNPGPAAIGAVIKDAEDRIIGTISQYIGVTTNNQAEYQALIAATEKAISLGAREIVIYSDSELMVSQINGHYRVKNSGLLPLFRKVGALRGTLDSFFISYVPREHNAEADRLANKAFKGLKPKL
jgi:ribonuclease HI